MSAKPHEPHAMKVSSERGRRRFLGLLRFWWLWLSLAVLLTWLLLGPVLLLTGARLSDPIPFDRARWNAETGRTGRATGPEPSDRSRMVTDLLDAHSRPGLGRSEVQELLGPPLVGAPDASVWNDPAGFEVWPTGLARHAVVLRVEFDENDRVRASRAFAKPE